VVIIPITMQIQQQEKVLNRLYSLQTKTMKSDNLSKQKIIGYKINKVTYTIETLRNKQLLGYVQ
jgi:hypothetical protein